MLRYPMWHQWLFFAALLSLLLSSGCASAPPPTTAVSPAPSKAATCVIRFGAALSLTGKTAREGRWIQDGYNLYVSRLNAAGGVRVGTRACQMTIQYYDDQSDPATSARLVEKLLTEDRVQLLLGPYGTDVTFAASAVAEQHRVPMVEAGGSGIKIFARGYRYVFGMSPPAPTFLLPVIDLALATDPTVNTVALFVEDDGFAKEVANGLVAYIQEKGLTLIFHEQYPKNASDVTALIEAAKSLKPDLVLGAGHLADSILLVRTARARALYAKLFAFSVGPTSQEFSQALGADAHYVVGVGPWTEAMQFSGDDLFGTPLLFAQAMRATYDAAVYATVPYQAAAAAAALETYRRAIEAAGTYEDPLAVRDALAAVRFNSFYGPVAFSPEGMTLRPMSVVQIGPDNHLYTVYPADARNGSFIFPAPNSQPGE